MHLIARREAGVFLNPSSEFWRKSGPDQVPRLHGISMSPPRRRRESRGKYPRGAGRGRAPRDAPPAARRPRRDRALGSSGRLRRVVDGLSLDSSGGVETRSGGIRRRGPRDRGAAPRGAVRVPVELLLGHEEGAKRRWDGTPRDNATFRARRPHPGEQRRALRRRRRARHVRRALVPRELGRADPKRARVPNGARDGDSGRAARETAARESARRVGAAATAAIVRHRRLPAAAPPRPVSADCPSPGRGAAATRLRELSISPPRRRRDPSASISPRLSFR